MCSQGCRHRLIKPFAKFPVFANPELGRGEGLPSNFMRRIISASSILSSPLLHIILGTEARWVTFATKKKAWWGVRAKRDPLFCHQSPSPLCHHQCYFWMSFSVTQTAETFMQLLVVCQVITNWTEAAVLPWKPRLQGVSGFSYMPWSFDWFCIRNITIYKTWQI